jgi:CubicO group peptidase (beta-lactamase class C family)
MSEPVELLDSYIAEGVCAGAQLVVWRGDERVLGHAAGIARPGEPLTSRTKTRLDCAIKPVLAMAMAWMSQHGMISLRDPVGRYVPEFGVGGKEEITSHHLLTHTAGLFVPDGVMPYLTPLDVLRRRLFEQDLGGWEPGRTAVYDTWGGWYVMAELISRVASMPWQEFLAERVLRPGGLGGLDLIPRVDEAVELPYRNRRGTLVPVTPIDRPEWRAYENPAYGGYGSMDALADLHRLLSDPERCQDALGLDPEPLRTPQRPRMYDFGLRFSCTMGYGMFTDLHLWNYSSLLSPGAFGHHSNGGTWAFADPAHRLVVALRINGAPRAMQPDPSAQEGRRDNPVIHAVYREFTR